MKVIRNFKKEGGKEKENSLKLKLFYIFILIFMKKIFFITIIYIFLLSSCSFFDKEIIKNLYITSNGEVYVDFFWQDKINLMVWVDVKTFKKIDENDGYKWFYKDKNNLYYIYEISWEAFQAKVWYSIIDSIDIEKFIKISDNLIRDDDNIYYLNNWWNFQKIGWIDIDSLEIINDYFIKDKNKVYYFYYTNWWKVFSILDWADPETFKCLTDGGCEDKNKIYLYDGFNQVETKDKAEDKKNEASYKVLWDWYSIINWRLFRYKEEYVWDISDVNSFENFTRYFKDKYNIYYIGYDKQLRRTKLLKLENIDISSFQDLWKWIIKDNYNIYERWNWRFVNITQNIDVKTFQRLSDEFAKDKNKIYWKCRNWLTYSDWVEDNDSRYYYCELENADVKTFQIFPNNPWIMKDKNKVYYRYYEWWNLRSIYKIWIIKEADSSSILFNKNILKDKYNTYIVNINGGKYTVKKN